MDCSPPASFVHGISQARILECVAIFFSRGSSRPRDWTCVCCTCRQILYRWATREAPVGLMLLYKRNPTKFHFIMWRFSEKMAICYPRSSSSPSNKSAGTLVLDFLASRNVRNKFLLWNSVVKWSEVKSLSHVRLFVTPWTIACQCAPPVGFSRQEYWSGLPFPSPGDLPNPGIEPRPTHTVGRYFTVWATREDPNSVIAG